MLTLGTALFALPVGVAAGIYLAEYAKRGPGTRVVRLSIANMAGVPSIVYGLFGLSLFVIAMKFGVVAARRLAHARVPHAAGHHHVDRGGAAAGPAGPAAGVARARGDASCGRSLRVVLPAAAPGIVTGSILGLSRAAGETAPIIFTAAAFFAPMPRRPSRPGHGAAVPPLHHGDSGREARPDHRLGHRVRSRRRRHRRRSLRGRLAFSAKEQGQMVDAPHVNGTFDLERRLGRLRQGDGARRRDDAHPAAGGHGAHRPVGLRQVHAAALPEPHERRARQRDGRRQGAARRRGHQRARRRPGRAAHARGHGVPAAQPVPDDHLRQRRLRPADPGHSQARRARRPRRGVAHARGAVDRGQEVAQEARVRALRRPAAAAVHRARARDAARGAC